MKMLLEFVIWKCPICVLTPCTFLPMTTSEKPHGIWRHYFYNTTTRSFSTFILETLPLIDPVWIFCILLNILPNIVLGNHCKKLEILFHTQFYVKWFFVKLILSETVILRLWNFQNWFHVKYERKKNADISTLAIYCENLNFTRFCQNFVKATTFPKTEIIRL